MERQTVFFKKEEHRQQQVLSIYAPNTEPFNGIIRKLGCTYSASKRMWWLPWSKEVTNTAFKAFKGVALVDYSALKIEKGGKEKEQPAAKTFKVFKTGVSEMHIEVLIEGCENCCG